MASVYESETPSTKLRELSIVASKRLTAAIRYEMVWLHGRGDAADKLVCCSQKRDRVREWVEQDRKGANVGLHLRP